ncbi:MAG: hypothetical protein GX221_08720 [Candidatus Riflebacteria bacterium]|nr:hypothetical protein [Candidatus Riflebacteria bacterium]
MTARDHLVLYYLTLLIMLISLYFLYKYIENKKEHDELTEIDKHKSRTLTFLSHELKTPLAVISGYLELMLSGKTGALTDQQKKSLKITLDNVSKLDGIINSILNYFRLEAGKIKPTIEKQAIRPVIIAIANAFEPILNKRQIILVKKIEENLPKANYDYALINLVLSNLLDNAIKFSADGSQIELSAEKTESGQVKVSVKDQGKGIEQKHLKFITKAFYQGEEHKQPGLGIGLAVSSEILKLHNTTLEIESEQGKGSKFSFELEKAE